ncbi:Ser/Thr protein phosphatase [Tritrichomonas foetus]|uniref:Serine/threonine-protein phosphatase n=1 Tax=Tritrichomonas foetus TaxID=1144522 RepID=A0A1J4J9I1_9EUKA|nr:Ser/Thr protein phosphatase [Tritrichomonas foetus]|eukprot:OHS94085.1 Ser/Thr protein phosphatase [Tritrichomonas foetus]
MGEYNKILSHFLRYSIEQLDDIACLRQRLVLPNIPPSTIDQILRESLLLFKNEPSMLTLKGPIIVVGDLHGHLLDLLRIIQSQGLPSEKNQYLFLGDIVDRGEFSFETAIMILLLKLIYPSDVFLIRGNHEFYQMGQQFGFFTEITDNFPGTDIFFDFMKTFSQIPISAIINDSFFCVHGGIGPNIFSRLQFENIQRPIVEFNDPMITSILWSDPSDSVADFQPSKRGSGYFFGQNPLETFLKDTNTKAMIRGHECVTQGVKKMFDDKVITVFSASNYCGYSANNSGILKIGKSDVMKTIIFDPYRYIKRKEALFVDMIDSMITPSISAAKSLLDISPIRKPMLGSNRRVSIGSANNPYANQVNFQQNNQTNNVVSFSEESNNVAKCLTPKARAKNVNKFETKSISRKSLPSKSVINSLLK